MRQQSLEADVAWGHKVVEVEVVVMDHHGFDDD